MGFGPELSGNVSWLGSIILNSNIMQTDKVTLVSSELNFRESFPAVSEMLLFSNSIASESDRNMLGTILAHQLKRLFNIQNYSIYAISENEKYFWPILYEANSDFARHPDFRKLINKENRIDAGIFGTILHSGALTFDADLWFRDREPKSNALTLKNIGLKSMMGVPIRIGDENIGIMIFRAECREELSAKRDFFRAVCSQIGVLISTIIAQERVGKLLNEINDFKQKAKQGVNTLTENIKLIPNQSQIIGSSPAMQIIFQLVAQVAPSGSTVLLLGETGTGKELIARSIHEASSRAGGPMVKVNCGSLPANLVESELFGHEKGSFTGAFDRRIGKFELADGGTLFLDEIGEMPLDLQVKLLRALQEREIERLGGKKSIKVDVRIIAATNRDLEAEVEAGRFRKDLYYRLNVFPIILPPLRERRQDIPALASYFIELYAKKAGKPIKGLNHHALQQLIDYHWPGNVRELEHLMERSVLLCLGRAIEQIPLPVKRIRPEQKLKTIIENERDHILNMLNHCNGRISGNSGAAKLLGVPPSTLNSKLKKMGIRREHAFKSSEISHITNTYL
jgi:transcriptional regulator with GAF, ATPase, and Fis domain